MTTPQPSPLDQEIDAFVQLAVARYGDRLTGEGDLDRLRVAVTRLRRTAATMAEFELNNGDEPATRFAAGEGS